MKVKLVFDDWKNHGRKVKGEEYVRLSEHDFHSGTTFDAEVFLDDEQRRELLGFCDEGFQPTFILYVR